MKKLFFLGIAMSMLLTVSVVADVPQMINYQGELTDNAGNPVDTTVSITFTIYDDSTNGVPLWSEVHPNVSTSSGRFNVKLGITVPIDDSVFNEQNRWLGIAVGGDSEITPRTHFVSVPYAFRISTVDGATGGIISGEVSITEKSTIGPGNNNTGNYSFVAGQGNTATGAHSVVFGYANSASGAGTSIGGGKENYVENNYSTICGGSNNTALLTSFVGGGSQDTASGYFSVVGGGNRNVASGYYSAVLGGQYNSAGGQNCTVGGGYNNTTDDYYSTVGGGIGNTASGQDATIAGGSGNTADAGGATIGGGWSNTASGSYSTIGGGADDTASGQGSTIGGGSDNTASGTYSTIGGGLENNASNYYSTVGGGEFDTVSGWYSVVPGGCHNTASGFASLAAGYRAKANHGGTFVWADSAYQDFASTGVNQFLIRASGGVGIGTNNPSVALHVVGDICYTGSIGACSDVRYKRDVRTINGALDMVGKLRGVTFNWKDREYPEQKFSKTPQLGLIAQEVKEIFPEVVTQGNDGYYSVDYARLTPVLIEAVKELKSENDTLRAQIAHLTSLVENVLADQSEAKEIAGEIEISH